MVVRSDGTKWACQSCLKGHRVSGCNHTDRELTLVPKKGRPVTQCQHCRHERKKRSAHVSCDCGEVEKPHHPKEKCIHLREAEEKAKAGFHDDHPVQSKEQDSAHLAAVAEEQGCCCHHGGKCTCSMLKREVNKEDDSGSAPHGPAVKPRLETTRSEGSITKFENGHHKPVHRRNHLAHESGMPYKMPMPRSQTDEDLKKANARRSVDSLGLQKDAALTALPPQTSASFNAGRRLSKSEQPSPKFGGMNSFAGYGPPRLSPIDFGGLDSMQPGQTGTGPSADDFPFTPLESLQTGGNGSAASGDNFNFAPLEPLSGVTESNFDPWSALPSGDNANFGAANNYFGVWPTGSTDNPGLAPAASSGTQSEIDEIPAMDDMYSFGMPSIQEVAGNVGTGAVNVPATPQSDRRSLPPDFFSGLPSETAQWQANDFGDFSMSSQPVPKEPQGPPLMNFNDSNMWQVPTFPPLTDLPHRQATTQPQPPRPSPQSLSHSTTGTDDVFEELFPGLDCGTGTGPIYPTSNNSSSQNFAADFSQSLPSSAHATSAPKSFDPAHTNDFASQPWDGGGGAGMSVPAAAAAPFASPYNHNNNSRSSNNLGQGFSGQGYSSNWSG